MVVYVFWGLGPFHRSCQIYELKLLILLPYYPFVVYRSVVMSPTDSGNVYHSPFIWISFGRDLSILLIFSKNHLFVSLIFSCSIFSFTNFCFYLYYLLSSACRGFILFFFYLGGSYVVGLRVFLFLI